MVCVLAGCVLKGPFPEIREDNVMQTHLEIFYMRILGGDLRYKRKQVCLNEVTENPERIIQSLIQQKYHVPSDEIEAEFVIHSTSWRYAPPDKVILTYVAYSDDLELEHEPNQKLPLCELRIITPTTPRPNSPAELERQVVSHALRHMAFLVKTDSGNGLKQVLAPDTIPIFEELWIALAGQVYPASTNSP
jgi:hypothetical protein